MFFEVNFFPRWLAVLLGLSAPGFTHCKCIIRENWVSYECQFFFSRLVPTQEPGEKYRAPKLRNYKG